MSQAGTVGSSTSPSNLTFVEDVGSATSSGGIINIVGGVGITTSGAGSTVTITASATSNTITGNTGGAISPSAGNWNTLGTGSITIAGSGSTLTTQLTGLTNHAVQVGAGTATLTQLAVGTNGQVLIGATGADPAFATLTSTGGTITYTTGPNTLNLEASATVATTYTADSGTATPALNNLNVLGQKASTVAVMDTIGSGSTLSIEDRTWQTQYVVDASSTAGLQGTFTTVQSAINQASTDGASSSVSKTVFIRPGTYTENLTLKTGVSLKALIDLGTSLNVVDPIGSVVIDGQASDSGGAVSNIVFNNIRFKNTNATPTFSLANNSQITFTGCTVFGGTTALTATSGNNIKFNRCNIQGSLTLSNASALLSLTTINCNFTGSFTFTIGTNVAWTDFSSYGIKSIVMSSNAYLVFNYTNFGDTSSSGPYITGTSSSGSTLTGCSFQNGNGNAAITCTAAFSISGLMNSFNSFQPAGFYSSAPTIYSCTAQQGNIMPSTVQTGATYTVDLRDYYVGINHAGSVAVTLPTSSTPRDRVFIIKDQSGAAGTNNITVTPATGTIDGAANFVMNTNYGSITVKFDGTNYFII